MKILSNEQVRSVEGQIIERGTTVEELMERAGAGAAAAIRREYPKAAEALFFIGKGNNGADGLVVARHLARAKWQVALALAVATEQMTPLCLRKLEEFRAEFPMVRVFFIGFGEALPWPTSEGIIVDALLGIGARGKLSPLLREAVAAINRAREDRFFRTVAIDGPTGLHQFAEKKEADPSEIAIIADLTLSIGFGKDSLFREEWGDWVGRIELISIFPEESAPFEPQLDEKLGLVALEPDELRPLLPRRWARSHKNDYGRVVIVGGSRGMVGAPLIAATGALRVGAGLVNLGVRSDIFDLVAGQAPLEAMVSSATENPEFGGLLAKARVIAVGPGLGHDQQAIDLLSQVLFETKAPLVIDADALILLARNPDLFDACRYRAILTPHPGEMQRLLGKEFTEAERPMVARNFANEHGIVLVLKGTRTLVAEPALPLAINTTGNAGLAAGGSGDLLTGIIVGLLAQGLGRGDAARLAVWLHGRAADIAVRSRGCEEGLGAVEVSYYLAEAIADLRR